MVVEEKQNPLGYEKISTLVRKMAIPAIVANVVNALYNIVDQIFIGQGVGYLGNAATNIAFPITTICMAIGLMVGIGAASNFNLALGRKEDKHAREVAGTAVVLLLTAGLMIMSIVLLFLQPLLNLFGATDQILGYASEYDGITALGIPFFMFSIGFNPLVRADGRATYSMMAIIIGALLNTVLDPLFIFGFNMGIAGAAWATVISQIVSALVLVAYIPRFRSVHFEKGDFKLSFEDVKVIASLGLTSFIFQISATIVQITSNNLLRTYGAQSVYGSDIPIAVGGVVSKIFVIFIAVVIGLNQGAQPILGFNYGAKKYSRVHETMNLLLKVTLILSTILWILFEVFPLQLIQMFGNGDALYYEFGVRYARAYLFFTFINGITIIVTTFFPAIGKAKLGAILSLTRQLFVLLPVMLLLSTLFGVDGLVFSGPVSDFISFIICITVYLNQMRKIPKADELLV